MLSGEYMELEMMTCLLVGQYMCPEAIGNGVWGPCLPLPSCPIAQAGCGRGGNAWQHLVLLSVLPTC